MDKELSVNDIDLLNSGLVFTKSENENEPVFTTDMAISTATGFSKEYVDRKIRTHEKRLLKFGVYGTEFRKPISKNGGRPIKIIKLNKKQAMALCTTFDDSEEILDFKFKLADAFVDAIDLLHERKIKHVSMKPTTKMLHDAIYNNDNFHKGNLDYSNIHKLIYKKVLGMPLSRYQKQHDIPKNKPKVEYLNTEQLNKLDKIMNLAISYLNLNCTYVQLRTVIEGITFKLVTTAKRPELTK